MITVNERNAYENVLSVGTKLYRMSIGGNITIREVTIVGVNIYFSPSKREGFVDRVVLYEIDWKGLTYYTTLKEEKIGKTYFLTKASLIEHCAKRNGCKAKVWNIA